MHDRCRQVAAICSEWRCQGEAPSWHRQLATDASPSESLVLPTCATEAPPPPFLTHPPTITQSLPRPMRCGAHRLGLRPSTTWPLVPTMWMPLPGRHATDNAVDVAEKAACVARKAGWLLDAVICHQPCMRTGRAHGGAVQRCHKLVTSCLLRSAQPRASRACTLSALCLHDLEIQRQSWPMGSCPS